jgi:hypothetical protein
MSQSGIPKASSLGISLGIFPYVEPGSSLAATLREANMPYIDMDLWAIVDHALPSSCSETIDPCTLPADRESRVLAAVRAHLGKVASDRAVVGFYLLDDYHGNVRDLLTKIHSLVQQASSTSVFARPTICAFQADLDYQGSDGSWRRNRTDFLKRLVNYSPLACDLVSIYSYTSANAVPPSVDWGMGALIGDVKAALSERGWTLGRGLIGTPMAFSYVGSWTGPTGDQLRTQMGAFCAGGATGIWPFAWDDGYSGPKLELGNDPDLQRGLENGLNDCRRQWGA